MDTRQARIFLRGLNNSGARILLAFIFAGQALDVNEIKDWTGLAKRETVYEGLRYLKSIGMVENQVASHGRNVWLPAGDLLPGFGQMSDKRTPELQMSEKGTPILAGGRVNLTNRDSIIDLTPHAQMSEKGTPEIIEAPVGFPSVAKILRFTHLLFDGAIVFSTNLEQANTLEVLGWLAYTYKQRSKFTAPAGFVRNRLMKGEQPAQHFMDTWREILPVEYLKALGFEVKESEEAIEAEEQEEDADLVREDRNELWLAILRDDRFLAMVERTKPRVTFHSLESVLFDGNTMRVIIQKTDRRASANEHLAGVAGELLSELIGRVAVVEFVGEE